MTDDDIDAVIDGLDAFYAGHDMVPRQTREVLRRARGDHGFGEPIRAYRVAVATDGSPIAGAAIMERFKLMTDHIDSVPLPIAILGRITGLLPADRIIRSVEIGLAWHAPGRSMLRGPVWDAIRFEWRDRANTVVGLADPRGSLIEAFHVGRSLAPRVELMAPVRAPCARPGPAPLHVAVTALRGRR